MLEETRPNGHGRARGLVSSRQSGQRVEAHTFRTNHPRLLPWVDSYWSTHWDLEGQTPHLVQMLSDPCVNIAFEEGKNRVVGVSTSLWTRELSGRGSIRAVKLKAGATCAFFARSAHELTNRVEPLDAPEISRKILEAATDETAFAELESWLESQLISPVDPKTQDMVRLVEEIRRDSEILTAEALARRAGYGLRPLQRMFRAFVGASPKWVIRRIRLQDAAVRLEKGVMSLADLASDLGYADHAHFTRDFKSATGRTPSEFAAENHV